MNTSATTTVVCLGDSITKGNVSYNWLQDLAKKMPQYRFVNHGCNGDLAYHALLRLDAVIKDSPDIVVLLLGTNDVLHTIPEIAHLVKKAKLPQKPDIDWFQVTFENIITELRQRTKARILVVSLPILGEGLRHHTNTLVALYNERIRRIVEQYHLEYIPLNEALVGILEQEHPANPVALQDSIGMVMKAPIRRLLFRQRWETISAANGLKLTTDNIHLNTRSGKILADLVAKRLLSQK